MNQRGLPSESVSLSTYLSRLLKAPLMISLTWTLLSALALSVEAAPQGQQTSVRKARKEIVRAERAFQKKNYRLALKHFKLADQLLPDLKNKISIAVIYHKLNQCSDSFYAWLDVLDKCQQGCRYKERVEEHYTKMTTSCTGPLTITSIPAARVEVDGRDIGQTPIQTQLLFGSHKLELKAMGYKWSEQRVNIEAAQAPLRLDITLEPLYEAHDQLILQSPVSESSARSPSDQVKFVTRVLSFGLGALSATAASIFYINQHDRGDYEQAGPLLLGGAGLFFITGFVTFF